ncbi:sulfur carrier protein ThiS [Brevibacterium samyangense]|uniref:Sulfur carrier protein ThiS n=1 Tax=Brevibacterium samyangense TaxID=366888 RepID=A0ABN2TLV5_9MICO
MSVTVTVNGEAVSLPDPGTVRVLVADRLGRPVGDDGRALDGAPLGIAVAVDDRVVPRSRWASTVLAPGARCEFVTAVQGG